jgi:Mrp family chromosome partitioning ATPase
MSQISEFLPPSKRIVIITGHYGSGKTEFAVSLALRLAAEKSHGRQRMALVDLDIVNPYFRSRERMSLLEGAGVKARFIICFG